MLTLKMGDDQPEVWLLKVWLNGLLNLSSKLPLDRPFGPNTRAAVIQFQASHGLSPDGVVGPMTWRALAEAAKRVDVPAVDSGKRPSHLHWPLYLRDLRMRPINPMRFRSAFIKSFGASAGRSASGLETFVGHINRDKSVSTLRFFAYMLATIKWETKHSFEPRLEDGCQEVDQGDCPHGMFYCKAVPCPNSQQAKYSKLSGITKCPSNKTQHIYHGRGYIQLTLYDNYVGMQNRLGIPLIHSPEKALVADDAYKIIASWFSKGPPTGKNKDKPLSDFVTAHKCDYYHARDLVNTDKDHLPKGSTKDIGRILEEYAQKFEVCLAYGMGTFLG